VNALKWESKLYALPLGGQTCVMAINQQLVQAAGATMPSDDCRSRITTYVVPVAIMDFVVLGVQLWRKSRQA